MRFLLLTLILSASLFGATNFDEALGKAGSEDKDIIVLIHGSDWNVEGEVFKKELWDKLQPIKGTILLSIDRRDQQTEKQKELDAKNAAFFKKIPVEKLRNLPAIVYCDKEGRPVAILRRHQLKLTLKQIQQRLEELKTQRLKRDQLWQRAEKAKGVEKARLLGQGYDVMDYEIHNYYNKRALLKELKRQDPEDRAGYLIKYSFQVGKYSEGVMKKVKAKKYEEAMADVRKSLKSDKLLMEQRQQLTALLYTICKNWPDQKAKALKHLQATIKLSPKSRTGRAATYVLKEEKRRAKVEAMKPEMKAAVKSEDKEQILRMADKMSHILKSNDFQGRQPKNGGLVYTNKAEGHLLNEGAYLTTSSSSHDELWYRPFVLSDKYRSFFHTGRERRPWAMVELAKTSTLNKIVVFNRSGHRHRAVPIKISVSLDGLKWTEVYRSEEEKVSWVALVNKVKARFVKVERDHDRRDHFHLTNILIYGK